MNKLDKLKLELKEYKKICIAYSGGCDSNFLFHVAVKTLGKENVLAVLVEGYMMPKNDLKDALEQLKGYNYKKININVFDVKEFKENDKKRCYFCKKNLMSRIKEVAASENINYVLDGKNKDDEGVYRPGNEATKELGIISPLFNNNLSKEEIRTYSKELGISTFDKPSNACLASRFNYGVVLTKEKLMMVDKAETIIHSMGIRNVRVRVESKEARIEVDRQDINTIISSKTLVNDFKKLGFETITLDLEGIKHGGYDKGEK
ncbi:MAG: ATP-dependent sacrificial sulfur transferase LarE [Thomasclavelia sp.]|jgi:uncharacterized protein|nr:ATP-dependent sacrificial sulfur transferase LarE [Thomasclavelia sp.]